MLTGFLAGLLVAWVLSWFGVNHMLISCIQPFVHGVVLNDTYYYLVFAIIGVLGGAFTNHGNKD